MKEATPFNISDYLDTDEKIIAYLSAVIEEGDVNLIIRAIGQVAKAKGMATVAKESGLGRESLYKSFAEKSHPKFDTIFRVLDAIGINLNVSLKSGNIKEKRPPIQRTRTRIASISKKTNSLA